MKLFFATTNVNSHSANQGSCFSETQLSDRIAKNQETPEVGNPLFHTKGHVNTYRRDLPQAKLEKNNFDNKIFEVLQIDSGKFITQRMNN